MIMKLRNLLCACASVLCLSVTAANAADPRPLEAAWKAAMMDFEGVLTDEQHTAINSIAYHSAAARLCADLELDVDKVGSLMNTIAAPADHENTPDDVQLERLTNILVTLGTIKGLMLAEGSLDQQKFCDAAVKAKAEGEHLWK
jgi:hypothetical protein